MAKDTAEHLVRRFQSHQPQRAEVSKYRNVRPAEMMVLKVVCLEEVRRRVSAIERTALLDVKRSGGSKTSASWSAF